jgi:hypothetical protein
MKELPGHSPANTPVIEAEVPESPVKGKHADSQDINSSGGTKAG